MGNKGLTENSILLFLFNMFKGYSTMKYQI